MTTQQEPVITRTLPLQFGGGQSGDVTVDGESKPLLWKRQKKGPGPEGTTALQPPFVATKDVCSFSLTTSVPCSIKTSDLMIPLLIGVQHSGRPFMKHSHSRPPPRHGGLFSRQAPAPLPQPSPRTMSLFFWARSLGTEPPSAPPTHEPRPVRGRGLASVKFCQREATPPTGGGNVHVQIRAS